METKKIKVELNTQLSEELERRADLLHLSMEDYCGLILNDSFGVSETELSADH